MICKEDYENTKSAIDVIAKGEGDRYSLTRFQSLTCEARFGFDGCSYQKNAQRLLDILEYAEHKNDDRLMPEGTEWPKFEDGEPVKFGDKASLNNRCGKVSSVKFYPSGKRSIKAFCEDASWDFVLIGKGECIKRPEPKQETLQDVIDDCDKGVTEYWKCSTIPCSRCPSEINGKTPQGYYGTTGCDAAKLHDIKRRLEAIQERMGGDE